MAMKPYTVYYIVKANRQEYARSMVVTAGNARGACKRCKELVYEKLGATLSALPRKNLNGMTARVSPVTSGKLTTDNKGGITHDYSRN